MNPKIKLVAIDIDGTLFDNRSQISLRNQEEIRRCTTAGIEIVISTGRPYIGLPAELLATLGIRYAITANGSAIYELPEKKCIYENCMEPDFVCSVLAKLQKMEIHLDAFIDGNGFSQHSCAARIDRLDMPESNRQYIKATRTFTDDLAAYIKEHRLAVQKMLVNFYPLPDGTFAHRDEVKALLASYPEITFLSGGYHNLEFTKAGTSKGSGLLFLCRLLGFSPEETMAIGDTQNDLDILQTAAVGVAMGNASDDVRDIADFVTLTNEEDGVAHALEHFIP